MGIVQAEKSRVALYGEGKRNPGYESISQQFLRHIFLVKRKIS